MVEPSAHVLMMHPSDELYGADRVCLETRMALHRESVEVWFPDDMEYPLRLLTKELNAAHTVVRRRRLPVLRRADFTLLSLGPLVVRSVATLNYLARSRPRLVYVNTAALVLVLPIARLLRIRTILHLHEHLEGPDRALLGSLASFADRIICVSPAVRAQLPHFSQKKALVIFNGFDDSTHAAATRPTSASALTLLIASRWNAWKGHEALLEALARSARTDIRLIIAGGPPPSGAATDVRAAAFKWGVIDQCEFVGEVLDVSSLIDESDFVVVPSQRADPLPTIAIEALRQGTPVIGTAVGGIPEIVPVDCGFLVPPSDVDALSQLLRNLTRDIASDMSMACRRQFEDRFSRHEFAKSIRAAVQPLLSRVGRA